ncbi:uncharacterized protein MYCFIDRAFT_84018 [Pseudocercospora fijiensis CIRAD86]|uniref:Uncharacterized protein n=1 Tax=Pseudocercospora fijiensis (strain CIRAD86) TaxID=383855 RepID=M3AIA5_PSEFD|nr:uncharacterized protein MYCFIDRAFT_84018 [Pseudocercospora fijiensis CIRAD86]EME77207.1 hypothetical protein MYCFIDRAFT_84018 [Pseudocercospora fijiensis CIRAD86]
MHSGTSIDDKYAAHEAKKSIYLAEMNAMIAKSKEEFDKCNLKNVESLIGFIILFVASTHIRTSTRPSSCPETRAGAFPRSRMRRETISTSPIKTAVLPTMRQQCMGVIMNLAQNLESMSSGDTFEIGIHVKEKEMCRKRNKDPFQEPIEVHEHGRCSSYSDMAEMLSYIEARPQWDKEFVTKNTPSRRISTPLPSFLVLPFPHKLQPDPLLYISTNAFKQFLSNASMGCSKSSNIIQSITGRKSIFQSPALAVDSIQIHQLQYPVSSSAASLIHHQYTASLRDLGSMLTVVYHWLPVALSPPRLASPPQTHTTHIATGLPTTSQKKARREKTNAVKADAVGIGPGAASSRKYPMPMPHTDEECTAFFLNRIDKIADIGMMDVQRLFHAAVEARTCARLAADPNPKSRVLKTKTEARVTLAFKITSRHFPAFKALAFSTGGLAIGFDCGMAQMTTFSVFGGCCCLRRSLRLE